MTRCRSFSQETEILTVPENHQGKLCLNINGDDQAFNEHRNSMVKAKSYKSSKSEMLEEDREPIEMGEICQDKGDFINFEYHTDSRDTFDGGYEQENLSTGIKIADISDPKKMRMRFLSRLAKD